MNQNLDLKRGDYLYKLLLKMKYIAYFHIDILETLDIIMHNKTFNMINSRNLMVIVKKMVKYYTVPNKEG